MEIIWQPLINLLVVFYHLLFNNLGLAIIAFTIFIRLVLLPLTLPSMRAMQKMREFAPELNKIKQRHKGDKKRLMQAQADFYRQKGINPASGCLPQIVQLVVLIALFRGFVAILSPNGDIVERVNAILYEPLRISGSFNTDFLGRDLTSPDVIGVSGLPVPLPGVLIFLAAIVQLMSSKMMAPQTEAAEKKAKKTPGEMDDFMAGLQHQMLYLFPLMTIVIGYQFPAGLVLYWFMFSLFQVGQQYFISGWGGLTPWVKKTGLLK